MVKVQRRRRARKPPPRPTTPTAKVEKRDATTGRFVKGHCGGPGRSQFGQLGEYRKTVREAVTPKQLSAVLQKLLDKALGGDVLAAKVLLDRTLGKATAAAANADLNAVELPTLATSADAVKASNAILLALGDGRLTPDAATKYATVVELNRRALETHELAERLTVLEQGAAGHES